MKKIIFYIFAIILNIGLVDCAQEKIQNNNMNSEVVKEENINSIKEDAEIKEVEAKETKTKEAENKETETVEITSQVNNESIEDEIVDFSDCFENIDGCAVLYSPAKNQYTYYNKDMCQKQVSPYSTFKIVSTLIGLNNGIIHSKDSTIGYDETTYPIDAWNADLTLEEAFKSSCIWYFRKVIDQVGYDQVQNELNSLQYGNRDISEWEGSDCNPLPELNGFWLDSSLKISPKEQVDVLNSIFNNKTQYSLDNIATLKDIMQTETHKDYSLYGKTGTGASSKTAWFAGFFETNDSTYYFAVLLDDDSKENLSGSDAKEITEKIIEKFYIE
ncbi:bla regulator protein blaR1 [Anaerosporobacter mobilis DSM 15930]|jgi:bla regulator protein BlaR1|uniref:Beta-lactamase n=1 Tax=Anaerosporobacter mobilis DSM 15930 TaxID=1120996 RepID=A0A1M7N7B9_9FIRM|nr:penicillin-binding transpeptidase domain-containing protein [Anaerosporobacter mobilis]SHM98964.1 bla regulator protein blaR1 [Anaerosporobacter mobilis DSM 15930]